MDSPKNKTKIYLIVFSLAMSLVTLAFLKSTMDAPATKLSMTPEQQLAALQRSAPKSAGMDRFMKRELDKQSDERQAADDMSK
jgi:hypothetical protein